MSNMVYGATGEVWMRRLDNLSWNGGSLYDSFSVRMDATQQSTVSFGRTTKLGDSVALGPGSGWRQRSWEGGALQDTWSDKAMYQQGNASPTSRVGGLRMWSGFTGLAKRRDPYITSYAMCVGSGDGTATNLPKLYFAERNFYTSATNNPSGGFKAYSYNPSTGAYTQLNSTYPAALTNSLGNVLQGYSGFTSMCAATDDASSYEYIYFGTNLGLYIYYVTGDAWYADANCASGRFARDSMLSFKEALYYCADKKLWKRTPVAGAYGINGTHVAVAEHAAAVRTQGLAIWQNRLWYGVQFSGNRAAVHTSDGVSASQAFQMPDEFIIGGLIQHYGSLYIYGSAPQKYQTLSLAPSAVGQVWKYTGSSLTKIWEGDDGTGRAWDDRFLGGIYGAATMGSLLLWGWPGQQGAVNERACIMAYDAERDAIVKGPEIPHHPAGRIDGMLITSMISFNGTFACATRDLCGTYPGLSTGSTDTSLLVWNKLWQGIHDNVNNSSATSTLNFANTFGGYSTEYVEPARIQYLVSSEYFGESDEVANMTKTFLTGSMRAKVPDNTTIQVYAITESGNWYPPGYADTVTATEVDNRWRSFPQAMGTLVYTATSNGSTEWRDFSWDMYASSNVYVSGKRFRYALVLTANDTGNLTMNTTPEVDTIEFAWQVQEPKRRMWRLRFVVADALERAPDPSTGAVLGHNNTTADAMLSALDYYWNLRSPFWFYPPNEGSTGITPDETPVKVLAMPDGYSVQQSTLTQGNTYSQEAITPSSVYEVSMTLVEHIV